MKRWFKLYHCAVIKDRWFINGYIADYNKILNNLYKKKRFYSKRQTSTTGYDFDIIRAIPISKIMGKPVMEQYNRAKYKCPLHKEKTASFTVYKETNSWYCFGCAKGGSIIDLVMVMENCDAGEAIKKLSALV